MLNCEYCDYLKIITSNGMISEKTCLCTFSGFHFSTEDMDTDMEYPCKDMSYEDYLNRLNTAAKLQRKKIKETVEENYPLAV
jgi:hypothetical protein